ncbi:hypothetical protein W02_07710 [Nitrospira sp. KM1]|uniref:hypothetical protein n=1 Tax=Nitrospira sp. KM1 TaxID=1936990 RepID=UPI0013A771C8|nr:hypothetical protein [Nitrospira sp. KM1]BCA53631.1 hypothetical protein W02_07710 [Nitrospira sp. KM1]
MAGESSDEFQKELVDLFVQEAQEWLQNIHVALDELQQGPDPDRHAALIGILTGGVTNLGGSAATINLPEVERASFGAIPFIEALTDPQKSFSVQDFLSLCKQLGQIQSALTRATGVSFEDHGETERPAQVQPSVSLEAFLQALCSLPRHPIPGESYNRNLVGAMMDQVEAQIKAGVQQAGVDAIQGYLARMSQSEEAFAQTLDITVDALAERLLLLAEPSRPREGMLEESLKDVTQLQADAQQINAVPAISFLSGLQTFLSVCAQHRVRLAARRIDAVRDRLLVVKNLIHQWIECGRTERAAIDRVLQAGHQA